MYKLSNERKLISFGTNRVLVGNAMQMLVRKGNYEVANMNKLKTCYVSITGHFLGSFFSSSQLDAVN